MKRTLHFIAVCFPLSWGLASILWLSGLEWKGPPAMVLGVLYMMMPTVATVLLVKFLYGEPFLSTVGLRLKPNRWWVVAWLGPLGLTVSAIALSALMPGATVTLALEDVVRRMTATVPPEQLEAVKTQLHAMPVHPVLLSIGAALFMGPSINGVAALGEEVGWRGFLQKELKHLGFWKSSVLIAAIWGIWHAPLILKGHNYPQHPVAGVAMMTAFCMLLGPVLSFVRHAGKSVVTAAVAHGVLNATAGLALMVVDGGSDLTVGVPGVAGMAVLATLNVLLLVFWKRLKHLVEAPDEPAAPPAAPVAPAA